MPGTRLIAHRSRRDIHRLPAGQPGIAVGRSGGQQVVPDRRGNLPRFHDRVLFAVQPGSECTPQRGVESAHGRAVQEPAAAFAGVGPAGRLAQERGLCVVAGQSQRSVRAETCSRHDAGQLLPEVPGAQSERQLGTRSAAADPDQPEVADRGTARNWLSFQVHDLMAALPGRQRMHHAEHAPADHDDPLHPRPTFPPGQPAQFNPAAVTRRLTRPATGLDRTGTAANLARSARASAETNDSAARR